MTTLVKCQYCPRCPQNVRDVLIQTGHTAACASCRPGRAKERAEHKARKARECLNCANPRNSADWYTRTNGTRICAVCERKRSEWNKAYNEGLTSPDMLPEGRAYLLRGDRAGYDAWRERNTVSVQPASGPSDALKLFPAKEPQTPKWVRKVIDRSDN